MAGELRLRHSEAVHNEAHEYFAGNAASLVHSPVNVERPVYILVSFKGGGGPSLVGKVTPFTITLEPRVALFGLIRLGPSHNVEPTTAWWKF